MNFAALILVCAAASAALGVAATLATGALKRKIKRSIDWRVEEHLRRESRNLARERQRIALRESAEFINARFGNAKAFTRKKDLLSFALQQITPELTEGIYCEFGVYKGATINLIASRVPKTIHGFDSFEGLPEDWRDSHPRGEFKVERLPAVAKNVVLHKGWFDATLPKFAREHASPVAFLHIDCDLYSSAKTVFKYLGDLIVRGTVIVFDEYFNYPGWKEGEHKAFTEFVESQDIRFEWLAYNALSEQVAVRITAAPRRSIEAFAASSDKDAAAVAGRDDLVLRESNFPNAPRPLHHVRRH